MHTLAAFVFAVSALLPPPAVRSWMVNQFRPDFAYCAQQVGEGVPTTYLVYRLSDGWNWPDVCVDGAPIATIPAKHVPSSVDSTVADVVPDWSALVE